MTQRLHLSHWIFGFSLAALVALGVHWAIFFQRSVDLERMNRLNQLSHASVVFALTLGHGTQEPQLGPLFQAPNLEVVQTSSCAEGAACASIYPHYPYLSIRPSQEAVDSILAKEKRRRIMVSGEGALLFILISVCTFMLYSLVRQERRHFRNMEEFIHAVTHEMKTPLTGIKSLLQTFAAGYVPPGGEARLYAMGLKEAERLEHMIENVLLAGRIRDGQHELQEQRLEVWPLLQRFVEHRRRYLVDRPQSLKLMEDPGLEDLMVQGDAHAIQTILENLTDNAFKYGGPAPEVTLSVLRRDDRVIVRVSDGGIGFDPGKAETLFVPFVRATDARSAVQHGTGLGLSIARALARRMKGDLSAHSDGPGKGSRFEVSLPEVKA